MFALNAYLNLVDGTKQEYHVKVKREKINDTYAVYINGFSNVLLNADFGAGIDFKIDDAEEWMANFRHSDVWCMPRFGTKQSDIPDETQGLIYKKSDGSYGVIMPVVSDKYKCVLRGNKNGGITARLFTRYDKLNYCRTLAFVYAEGENPYCLFRKTAATALSLLNNGCRIREDRRYPDVFEYLGWCSWDAMEIRVNEEDLIKKCQEFKEKDIPVKWAIIDDMWGEVRDFYGVEYEDREEMFRLMHSSKLYSFQADPIRFPNGLKKCIDKMKEYGLKVGMWHPSTGYWKGIDPEGPIFKDYGDMLIRTKAGYYIPTYKQEKAYMFYSAFHDYLRESGADFVKIDAQSNCANYRNMAPVGVVSREYHNAMEASVGQHFDNSMINCMGMASEDMWNRSVSAISRCSDDFQPEDSAWFSKHITQCAYNSLVQGQFYYGDWDMWWTDDGQAIKNSILRAVSGGPIYVSDKLGRSNREVLMPLITNDGRILRCDRPAMPTSDCLTCDPVKSKKIFKLQNVCNDSGVIAVFNIDGENRAVDGTISPAEIDGLQGESFAVYEHFSRKLTILAKDGKMEVKLKTVNDFKLYVIVPIRDGFAAIGRTDKFISPKTVKNVQGGCVELTEPGEYAVVENGKLLFKIG